MFICLVTAIFFEARSEPLEGQFAVAQVIINRVNDPRWPDNICDVVNQPKQFSYTHDGKSDNPQDYVVGDTIEGGALELAKMVAKEVLNNPYGELTATHYHSIDVVPSWVKDYGKGVQIGNHIFYTAPQGK